MNITGHYCTIGNNKKVKCWMNFIWVYPRFNVVHIKHIHFWLSGEAKGIFRRHSWGESTWYTCIKMSLGITSLCTMYVNKN